MDTTKVCPICQNVMVDSLQTPNIYICSCGYSRPSKELITLSDYFGRYQNTHQLELTPEVRLNAIKLITKVNWLLIDLGVKKVVMTSGWRPASVNALIPNAAPKSNHISGMAIDIADSKYTLWDLIYSNHPKLKEFGLWMEAKDSQNRVHLDTKDRGTRAINIFSA